MLEILRKSYLVEGVYLAALGTLTVLRGVGLLAKEPYRYLVPSIGLLSSLILLGFLNARYRNELSQISFIGA